jgi:hypothetical protein
MTQVVLTTTRVLPWGEEVYLEIPIGRQSLNKFYARHGRTAEGKEYIEFKKFGPKPNTDGENYSQKLRLYSVKQWVIIKNLMEGELAGSIGWDLTAAQQAYEDTAKNQTTTKDK